MATTDQLQDLQRLQAQARTLEKTISAAREAALASLPAQFGFATAREFLTAFKAATRHRSVPAVVKVVPARTAGQVETPKSRKPRRRRRAKVTDQTRADVKKLAAAGKTGLQIAKALGISRPTVQNIKKALGLTQRRKK